MRRTKKEKAIQNQKVSTQTTEHEEYEMNAIPNKNIHELQADKWKQNLK